MTREQIAAWAIPILFSEGRMTREQIAAWAIPILFSDQEPGKPLSSTQHAILAIVVETTLKWEENQ